MDQLVWSVLTQGVLTPLVVRPLEKELKAADPMAWVGAMNNIRNRAEEIVLRALIYGEDRA